MKKTQKQLEADVVRAAMREFRYGWPIAGCLDKACARLAAARKAKSK